MRGEELMKRLVIELLDFLKSNTKLIIIATSIIAIIYTTAIFLLNLGDPTLEETEVDNIEESGAYFNFFVENLDGTTFTNTALLEQYILMDEVLEEVENATNTNIKQQYQSELLSDFRRTSDNRGVLGVTRNSYSNRLSLIVQTEDESDNLAIADYFYEMLQNKDIHFLENKNIYFFEGPEIKEDLVTEEVTEVDDDSSFDYLSLLANFITGLVFGFVLSSGIILIKTFFSNSLNYSFSYFRDETDKFLFVDKRLDNRDEIKHFITVPSVNERIILSEDNLSKYNFKSNNLEFDRNANTVKYKNSVENMALSTGTSEIVMIIVSGQTTRNWYKKQRHFLSSYDLPIKLIQINE